MTDKQIKQNAEIAYPGFEDLQAVYIEGAHSRDEEIGGLNARIVKLICERDSIKSESEYLINKLRDDNKDLEQALACAEDVIDIQKKQFDKFRNPWISVEEQLPIENQDILISHWNENVTRINCVSIGDINYMKEHPDLIKYWMLTPKVKRNESK